MIAFRLAQNDHVRLAHHLHAPAHLLAATRAGLPTLMPIRPPRDTVLSAAVREPTVPISIDRLNERFGTSFARFDDAADTVEAVFEIIEERARRPAWQHLLG